MQDDLLRLSAELAIEAGHTLLDGFGRPQRVDKKGDNSNIVTDADARAEQIIVRGIRRFYPHHSIIAEETGCDLRGSKYTWVVDPLDGTSNYAAGIPWFGVLVCVLCGAEPIAGVIHTPVDGALYAAAAGTGTRRNGQRVSVAQGQKLEDVLWAYGMDGGKTDDEAQRNGILLSKLLRRVRNIRTTNSLIDPAYTADGRLGGMLNQNTRIWDIAAPMLIVQEAGGLYTDAIGQPLLLEVSSRAAEKEYAVLAGAPELHREVAALVRRVLHSNPEAQSADGD